jgi:hypothetical protein
VALYLLWQRLHGGTEIESMRELRKDLGE